MLKWLFLEICCQQSDTYIYVLMSYNFIIMVCPDPGQETKAKMVWPCLKVFWFSKDNLTGHSKRKRKKRQTEEKVGRQCQRVDRNRPCQLN